MSDFPTGPLSDSVLNGSSVGGASRAAPMGHRPEQVGPYRILELIGEGGMGEVYKAERRHPIRQTVAVKIIKLGFDSREIVGRFESERQALAMMDHPSIAKVLDAGTTETGRPYFVMDFVAGKPITQFCDENRLSIDDRLRLFSDVCDAIAHAHTKAIIHRDIKPSNVLAYMQDGAPAVKVIDFGIAKALTSSRLTDLTVNTQSGRPIGTYECMSPEQVEGSADIDTRTDVYSLGVLLYELLTGAKPFDHATMSSATDAEIKRIIREVDPPRPSTRLSSLGDEASAHAERRQAKLDTLAKQLRSELEWIPLKAMRKERARRYTSPLQLKEDIQNYLEGRPLIAGPESRAYRARKFVSRNRGGVGVASIVAVAFLTGLALYIYNIRAEQARTRDALAEAERQKTAALAQEKLAKEQTVLAEATTNFLTSMLTSADPSKLLGDKVTVLQAAEAAVKSLDAGELKDKPQVESATRNAIGRTFIALGRYGEAAPNLQRTLELRRQHLPAGDPKISASLNNLASLLWRQGKPAEAEPLLREALHIRQAALPPGHPEIITSLNNLAHVLDMQGKYADVESLYRQALDLQRKASGRDDDDVAGCIENLAAFLHKQHKLNEVVPLFREVLAIRRKELAAGHPDIANTLNNLAFLLDADGKSAEAETLHREALQIRRNAFPAGHPEISTSLSNLALLMSRQNRLAEAEPLAREALDTRRKALPAGHSDIATSLNNLAGILRLQGKLTEAEPMFREGLAINQAALPAKHPNVAVMKLALAGALCDLGKLDEAESLTREALATYRQILPAGHAQLADAMVRSANVLTQQGKLAEAEPLFREALEMNRAKFGPRGAPTTQTAGKLADLLDQTNRPDEAASLRAGAKRDE